MCREAVASGNDGFSDGLNASIQFMLTMLLIVPLGVGFLVWRSYRRMAAEGPYQPEGKVRWTEGQDLSQPEPRDPVDGSRSR